MKVNYFPLCEANDGLNCAKQVGLNIIYYIIILSACIYFLNVSPVSTLLKNDKIMTHWTEGTAADDVDIIFGEGNITGVCLDSYLFYTTCLFIC